MYIFELVKRNILMSTYIKLSVKLSGIWVNTFLNTYLRTIELYLIGKQISRNAWKYSIISYITLHLNTYMYYYRHFLLLCSISCQVPFDVLSIK